MFTGIVQGITTLTQRTQQDGMLSLTFSFPDGFCHDLKKGASVAIDGVCLTVTRSHGDSADFDLILPTLLRPALSPR